LPCTAPGAGLHEDMDDFSGIITKDLIQSNHPSNTRAFM
jgi:hypothetical protein